MPEHTANIKIDPREIPYRIYCDYLVHIMFPNVDKKKILNNLQVHLWNGLNFLNQEAGAESYHWKPGFLDSGHKICQQLISMNY